MTSSPRAWTFTSRGSPHDVLSLNPSAIPSLPPLPLPRNSSPTEEWLLLKTRYVSLNPGSLYMMGLIPAWVRAATAVPESDLSAVVEDVWTPSPASPGGAQPAFKKGDRAAAFIPGSYSIPNGIGALSTHLALPARYCVPIPDAASDQDAAGVTLAACTAWQLLDLATVKKGDRVLVNGASGGIGTFAVQMARNMVGSEGYVAGICSGRNGGLVKSLGSDEVVDYTLYEDLPEYLKQKHGKQPFNAIVDTVGKQHLYKHCADYLVEGGIYAATKVETSDYGILAFIPALLTMKANEYWPLSKWLGGTGREWRSAAMLDPSSELKEEMLGMVAKGEIKVVVDSVWDMESVLKGYEILRSGRARGKILVHIGGDAPSGESNS